jgi:hypothetical protein
MGRYRPDFKLLIGNFCPDLVGKTKKLERQSQIIPSTSNNAASIPWIEKLLSHTPFEDHRKITVASIPSRYLIKIKKLDYERAYTTIWERLDNCEQLRRLELSRSHFDRCASIPAPCDRM